MDRLIERLLAHYRTVLIVLALLTIPLLYFYSKQTYFNHINVFFPKGDPEIEYYEAFQEKFGNDEMAVVVFKTEDIFTEKSLELIRRLTETIKPFEGVQRVTSLTEVEVAKGSESMVDFQKLVPADLEFTQENLDTLKKDAVNHPMIGGTLISRDGTTTAIVIELVPTSSNEAKHNLLNEIRYRLDKIAAGIVELHYSGGAYLEVEISDLTHKDNRTFTPISYLIIFAVVFLMLRNIALTVLGQINITVILIWSIGFLILCGESINSVTVAIAPILLAISISVSIHILSNFGDCYRSNGNDYFQAVKSAIKNVWFPCLFTSLTTFVGYLSFLVATVRPVITVGIFTATGVMIAYFMAMILIPSLLILFRGFVEKDLKRKKPLELATSKHDRLLKFMASLGQSISKRPVFISLFFLVFAVVVTWGMVWLRFETNFVSYLKDANPIKKDIFFIEDNIRGTVSVDLVVQAESSQYDFTHPESLKKLERVQKALMNYGDDHFTGSFSVVDYIKEIHGAFTDGTGDSAVVPENQDDIIDYYELGDNEIFKRCVSHDRMEARINVASKFGSTKSSDKFTDYLNNEIKPLLGSNYNLHFTGLSALYITMDRNLKHSQMWSFASALAVISIMMFFVCKNVKITFISIVPNLFPIFVTFGIMGWFNIPLDAATIMIASITIGLAVDDTIHFITWFRRNREAGMNTKESVLETFKNAGKPIVTTSVVLCLSYLVLVSGSVKPIIAFGSLASLAMFFALLGDLFILPSLLLIADPDIKPSRCFTGKKEKKEADSETAPDLVEALE